MAATARTTTATMTLGLGLGLGLMLGLMLALTFSLASAASSKGQKASGKWTHQQCAKYKERDLRNMEGLLKKLEQAPVGARNVNCTKVERGCLQRYLLPMDGFGGGPDFPCARVGSPCYPPWRLPEDECRVRASWSEWRRARRLVGECVCAQRCNETSLPVRVSPYSELSCAQAGHMLCACGRRPPPNPEPFDECECTRKVALQPAPFGGYECANLCDGICSPQRGPRCSFPVLWVEPSSVVHATSIFEQGTKGTLTDDKRKLNTKGLDFGSTGSPMDEP